MDVLELAPHRVRSSSAAATAVAAAAAAAAAATAAADGQASFERMKRKGMSTSCTAGGERARDRAYSVRALLIKSRRSVVVFWTFVKPVEVVGRSDGQSRRGGKPKIVKFVDKRPI